MKVEKLKNQFEPVCITLESMDEINALLNSANHYWAAIVNDDKMSIKEISIIGDFHHKLKGMIK